jgi:hypothetical protein
MFDKNFTFSKRQLGLLLTITAVVAFVAVLGIDIVDAGREGGIGLMQRLALVGLVGVFLLGLTLLPLGKDPA